MPSGLIGSSTSISTACVILQSFGSALLPCFQNNNFFFRTTHKFTPPKVFTIVRSVTVSSTYIVQDPSCLPTTPSSTPPTRRQTSLRSLACASRFWVCLSRPLRTQHRSTNAPTAGNGNILFFECSYLEVIVMTADYPESGWYGARLVDLGERSLLLGRQYAPSITAALRQLLQETCDSIRDNHILQNYTSA